jgi:hypothetical protein
MYGLAQIRPLLGKLEEQGVDCVVAGGFAVFLWAERYARTDSRYSALEPFISVDLDLIGDRDEAIAIGRALSVKPKLNPGTDPGPNAATLIVPGVGGQGRLRIDVLTSVFGCTYPEAFSSAQRFDFPDGTSTKVLDPFLCLQCKALNLLNLDQKTRRAQGGFDKAQADHRRPCSTKPPLPLLRSTARWCAFPKNLTKLIRATEPSSTSAAVWAQTL